ncbi:hypothetical protein FRC02_004644 [Tulasnella sp. 418]|nr:hypothetical protein FRC02_004644 [Tulasnella sp. 418]
MMEAQKNVRWAFDGAEAPDLSDVSMVSSPDTAASTLEFINAQLVSHGFVRSPGLQLGSLTFAEQDVVAKCLMGMLRQRMNDVSRSEELNTKLRTLTYEYERLNSIHQVDLNKTAQAESTAESAKAQKAAALKSLSASEQAHKQALANLSKAQTALQYGRSTAQNEIKRKEKEIERIMEKCTKICNEQARLGSIGAGLACANLAIVDGLKPPAEDTLVEEALSDLEADKTRLLNENDALRDVLLSCARSLQSLQHLVNPTETEAPFLTAPQLFTPELGTSLYDATAQAMNAHSKLREYLSDIREYVERSQREAQAVYSSQQGQVETDHAKPSAAEEVNVMKQEIQKLKKELDRKSNMNDKSLSNKEKELQEERARLNEERARLVKERAAIEEGRAKLLEEKHQLQVQKAVGSMPNTRDAQREREIENSMAMPQSNVTRIHKVRRGRSIGSPDAEIEMRDVRTRPSSDGYQGNDDTTAIKTATVAQPRPLRPALKKKAATGGSSIPTQSEQPPPQTMANPLSTTALETSPERANGGDRNPFDEVLLLSAQRPRPVFTEGSSEPKFQPLILSDPQDPDQPLEETTNPPSSHPPQRKSKSKGKPSSNVSPSKSRTGTTTSIPPPVTPPIFTHRRIVGKKHQYAPAVPSPLSRILRATSDSSFERSTEDDPGISSFNPVDESSAVGDMLTSSCRIRMTKSKSAPLLSEAPYMDDDDDGDQWQMDDDPDSELDVPARHNMKQPISKNTEPLTEDDLVMVPTKTVRDIKGKGPFKPPSNNIASQRQPASSHRKGGATTAPIRLLAPKTGASKPHEKENMPSIAKKPIRPALKQGLTAAKPALAKPSLKKPGAR